MLGVIFQSICFLVAVGFFLLSLLCVIVFPLLAILWQCVKGAGDPNWGEYFYGDDQEDLTC